MHNTRNTGYAKALAGIAAGAMVLDAATGGLGGCPFAPRATGKFATEDLVWRLERQRMVPGIDLHSLSSVSEDLRARVAGARTGLLARAGMFPPKTANGVAARNPSSPPCAAPGKGGPPAILPL